MHEFMILDPSGSIMSIVNIYPAKHEGQLGSFILYDDVDKILNEQPISETLAQLPTGVRSLDFGYWVPLDPSDLFTLLREVGSNERI